MPVIFKSDSITLTHPVNNSAEINYFGISCSYSPPEQILQKWGYIGQNGQQIKILGTSGQTGSVTGFVDADTEVNLTTGMSELEAAVRECIPGSLHLGSDSAPEILNGILTKIVFTSYRKSGNRWCSDFVIGWEAPK